MLDAISTPQRTQYPSVPDGLLDARALARAIMESECVLEERGITLVFSKDECAFYDAARSIGREPSPLFDPTRTMLMPGQILWAAAYSKSGELVHHHACR